MTEPTEDRDREFARAFLAVHFDPASTVAKCGVEILVRVLQQARREGIEQTTVSAP